MASRPALLVSLVAVAALLHVWHRSFDERRCRPADALLGATLALLLLLTESSFRAALLGQPWAGWDFNALAKYGTSFYVTYRASLEPVCLLGFVACLPLRRSSAVIVSQGTWLGLFVFLTAWGNYQSRYALPLIPLEALAVGVLTAQALASPRRPTDWPAAVLAVAWLTLGVCRSAWVLKELGLTNDFFYF
jgi:hypothetical protein